MKTFPTSEALKRFPFRVLDFLRSARIPRLVDQAMTPFTDLINRILASLTPQRSTYVVEPVMATKSDRIYNWILLLIVGGLIATGLHFILTTVGLTEVFKAFGLGLLTLLRVTVLLIFATLIWIPIGVAIGFNPKLARLLQPVVQFLASFPANFIFPFAYSLFYSVQP